MTNGGLWFGVVPEGTPFPFARITEVGPTLPEYQYTATSNVERCSVQIDVWHTDRAAVASLLSAINVGLHRQPLSLASGTHLMTLRDSSSITVEASRDASQREV